MPRGGIRILFAGGGTGGHVFPGIALARHSVNAEVFWLCTSRAFDAARLSEEGIPFEPLESPRWRASPGFIIPMGRALLASARRIRKFRPHVIVGVGGYGTVPPAVSAAALGVPYALLEQNARPGKANRFLAPGAVRIYAQWPQAQAAFKGCADKVMVTGSPLRQRLKRVPKAEALGRFGLEPGRPTLAVVGGSQGAEGLNRGVLGGLNGASSKLQILHVTGPGRVEEVQKAYRKLGVRAVVRDFVSDMESLYSAADLAVSRAGALAIAELAAFGVPAVLVPLPRSADGHQRENARAAAESGGAVCLEEDRLAGGLGQILETLVSEPSELNNMGRRMRTLARPGAASSVLEDLRSRINR